MLPAPRFLQVRPRDAAKPFLPLSIHVDALGRRVPQVAAAFEEALKGRGLGGVHLANGEMDSRDGLLDFLYTLAENQDLWDGLFPPEEIDHWLGFLGDDYLFSQPWTLGLALRRPAAALEHLARACPDDEQLGEALSRLGQGTYLPWLLNRPRLDALDEKLGGRLGRAMEARVARLLGPLADRRLSSSTLRHALAQRLCEEGLPLLLPSSHRKPLLSLLGLESPRLAKVRRWQDFERLFLDQGEQDVLGMALREAMATMEKVGALARRQTHSGPCWPGISVPGHALEGLGRLGPWARAYRKWWSQGEGFLLSRPQWPEVTPQIFRHYALLLTILTLHPLEDC